MGAEELGEPASDVQSERERYRERELAKQREASRDKALLPAHELRGRSSVGMFLNLLMGLQQRKWTGVVAAHTKPWTRNIYFHSGEVAFATSNLIDDRLGEVLYRNGQLSISELMNAASMVTRDKRFGRVLRESRVLDFGGLWRALQLQVRTITTSIFMYDEVVYEMQSGERAFTEITLEKPTDEFLLSCMSFGNIYRNFVSRLQLDSQIVMVEAYYRNIDKYKGTFIGDILSLAKRPLTVNELLKGSKLDPPNTLAILMHLFHKNIVTIANMQEGHSSDTLAFGRLSMAVAHYRTVFDAVIKAFQHENVEFPVDQLRNYCEQFNTHGNQMFFLDGEGQILDEGLTCMTAACREGREEIICSKLNNITMFALHIARDLLPRASVEKISELQNIIWD